MESDNMIKEDEKKSPKKSIEDILTMDKYCCLVLAFSQFCLLNGAAAMLFMMYAGAKPKSMLCISETSNYTDGCSLSPSQMQELNCTLEPVYQFESVYVDFQMYCEEGKWVKKSISVQMFGVLVGTLFSGSLSDRFGRLRIISIAYVFVTVFGLLSTLANDLISFTVLRTLLGFFNAGLFGVYGVYKTEHLPRKHRFLVSTVISWSPNMILLSFAARFSGDWRTFQYAISALSAPAVFFFFFIYESPRWLIQKGKIDEALRVLENIQKRNGKEVVSKEELTEMLQIEKEKFEGVNRKRKNYDARHLFSSKSMSLITSVFLFGKFSTSLANYGMMFDIETLSGSIFTNALLMGIIRWTMAISVGLMDFKFQNLGRKTIHLCAQSAIGISLLIIAVVFAIHDEKQAALLIRILTLIATSIASQVLLTKSMVTIEYYPTMVRNSAMSFESTFSRIGTIVAPLFIVLFDAKYLQYVLFAALSLTDAGLFQAFLPETKGSHLPDEMPKKKEKESNKLTA